MADQMGAAPSLHDAASLHDSYMRSTSPCATHTCPTRLLAYEPHIVRTAKAHRTYGKWPSSRDGMLNTCGETTLSWMRICGGSSCCTRMSPAAECGFECARDSGCGCIEKIRPASRREPAATATPPPPRARPPALPGNILAGVAADANAPQRVRTISYILVRPQHHFTLHTLSPTPLETQLPRANRI